MNLLQEIGSAKRIAIAGHVRPDGDAVSSCLATCNYLKNALPDAYIMVYLCEMPTIFGYLKGYHDINGSYEYCEPYDVFISLDCADKSRLDKSILYFEGAGKRICVDHHESNVGFADVNEIKPYASSTCEVLYDLFETKYIDDDVAMALYTGIVHDSGVFQYSNMSKHSFEIVGALTEYNFDGPKIIQESFYQKSYAQNLVLGKALIDSDLIMDGKIITSVISRETMSHYGVLPKHFEGIVNQLQLTRGIEVAIFMYEIETGRYKVSMRSNGRVNVADIAVAVGGGGHDRAAGADMSGAPSEVIDKLSEMIMSQLSAE